MTNNTLPNGGNFDIDRPLLKLNQSVTLLEDKILAALVDEINGTQDSSAALKQLLQNGFNNGVTQLADGTTIEVNQIILAINTAANWVLSRINTAQNEINNNVNGNATSIRSMISTLQTFLNGSINNGTNYLSNRLSTTQNTITARMDNLSSDNRMGFDRVVSTVQSRAADTIRLLGDRVGESETAVTTQVTNSASGTNNLINNIFTSISNQVEASKQFLEDALSLAQRNIETSVQTAVDNIEFGGWVDDLQVLLQMLIKFGQRLGGVPNDIALAAHNLNKVWTQLQTGKYRDYTEFDNDLKNLFLGASIPQVLWEIGKFFWVTIFGTIESYRPFINNIVTLAHTQANDNRLTVEQALRYFHVSGKPFDKLKQDLNELGYRDSDIERLQFMSFALLSPEIARYCWLNGQISETQHDTILQNLGYGDGDIVIIKRSYFLTPPVGDLITMAVREAFTPEIANLFGQYEDYPTKLTEYAKRNGLSEEWAKAYWAAHWRLPSAEQGFEMLHRGVIDQPTLKTLLRSLDVMPFWRDRLIELSYTPLRLVDIRRFFEDGVINRDEMYHEYLARGYDAQHAEWATEWTIGYVSKGGDLGQQEYRSITQTVIVKAYNTSRISRAEAVAALMELKYTREHAELILDVYATNTEIDREDAVIDDNKKRIAKYATDAYGARILNREDAIVLLMTCDYSENEAALELDMIDYEVDAKIKGHIVDLYKQLYITYKIDRDSFIIAMQENAFGVNEINRMLSEFDVLRESRTRQPTFEMLRRWFRASIIDIDQYINELKGLGFGDEYVSYFVIEEAES